MLRAMLSLLALLSLAACGAEPVWAPEEKVQAARYVHDGPPSVTLFTVINNRSNSGAHSGLMINGSERIMFDPAGTWKHPRIPERNDVHHGITPRIVNFYIDYHARETYRVVEQTVTVSPGVAALVAQRAKAYGAVPKAQCARSVTDILRGVPGFENIRASWYPNRIMDDFAKIPGVTTRVIRDEDADKNHGVLLVQAGEAPL
jgi:hypothetical protein